MKKALSRLSFYLFMTCLIARLIGRFAGFFIRIYARSLRESRGNFALVHAILLGRLGRVVKEGEITPEFAPYVTESLLFFLKATGEIKLDFNWSHQEYISYLEPKTEDQLSKLSVLEFALLVVLDERKYKLPLETKLSANAIAAINALGLKYESDLIRREDVKNKIISIGSKPSFKINPEEHPEIALALIARGKSPSRYDGWALPESINYKWLSILIDNNISVGFLSIKPDKETLKLWGSSENCQISAREMYESSHCTSHLMDMFSGCLEDKIKLSPSVYKCAEKVVEFIHPDIIPDRQDVEEPTKDLLPKNWRNEEHILHKKSIRKLFTHGGKLKSTAISMVVENYHYREDMGNGFLRDDLESQISLLKDLWANGRQVNLGDTPLATRILINTNQDLIRKLCNKDQLDSKTVVDYINMNADQLNYPPIVARASTKKLLRLAIIKNCPYASHKIANTSEDELLDVASNSSELSFIYDHCTIKKEENLSRYPDFVRDKHFAIDLGL